MKTAFNKYHILTFFGLFWLGLELLGLALSIAGIFYWIIILAYIVLFGAAYIFILYKNQKVIRQNFKFLPMVLASLLFIIILSSYVTPTVFSGRDQGSFSESAIRLSQNHRLTFSFPASREFFNIYGPGQALNFPGFDYTKSGELITHFPLGYIVWLAIFYSIFGMNGLIIADAVTLFIFLLCFFLIARYYLRSSFAIWTWILALTSFSFMWFFKFTLSENLALAFVWFGIWEFILFLKQENKLYLFASILSFLILAFARIEAWALLAMVIAVLYLKYKNLDFIKKIFREKKYTILLAAIILLFIISLRVNFPFYKTFAKGFISAFVPPKNEADIPSYSPSFLIYLIKVLGIYTILSFLVLYFLSLVFLIYNKRYEILTVAFITLPILIYLINPSISSDHPWMLRRFVFVILPVAILYSVIYLEKFFSKKFFGYAILFLLFAMNLIVLIFYFPVSENKNLLEKTAEISQNFGPQDLILIDRESAGSGWNMITGPLSFLYGKQAVYFFNPADINKIHVDKFTNVYMIISDKNLSFYEKSGLAERLTLKKEYRIETSLLNVQTGKKNQIYNEPVEFPRLDNIIVHGGIYQLK